MHQPDYSSIDKNHRAAEVLNALLGYARCKGARRNHYTSTPAEMTEKGTAIQALLAAVVALADAEDVVVTVENVVRAEAPVTGVFDTKVETRWARRVYQHYYKLNDSKLVGKTVHQLNQELGRLAMVNPAAWKGELFADVGYLINGVEIETEQQLVEYILNTALAMKLDLFTEVGAVVEQPKRRGTTIVDAAPIVLELGIEDNSMLAAVGDTMMAPVQGVKGSTEQERVDASLKSMLGFASVMAALKNGIAVDLSEIPAEALAVMTKIADRNGELFRRLMKDSSPMQAMAGDFGSYDEIQSSPLVKEALAETANVDRHELIAKLALGIKQPLNWNPEAFEAPVRDKVIDAAIDAWLTEDMIALPPGEERTQALAELREGLRAYYKTASQYRYVPDHKPAPIMSAAIGREIAENIRAHGSPVAMGHPYLPFPTRGFVEKGGSAIPVVIKDDGSLDYYPV